MVEIQDEYSPKFEGETPDFLNENVGIQILL